MSAKRSTSGNAVLFLAFSLLFSHYDAAHARKVRVVNFGDAPGGQPQIVNLSQYSLSGRTGENGLSREFGDVIHGGDGKDGETGPLLIIRGRNLILQNGVSLSGGSGGNGGSGQGGIPGAGELLLNAGNGGNGGKGGRGGELRVLSDTITIDSDTWAEISVDGGNGGSGTGGAISYVYETENDNHFCNTDGSPGNGGNGGNGAPAGKIELQACTITGTQYLIMSGAGGHGGNGGGAGQAWIDMHPASGKFASAGNGGDSYLCTGQSPQPGVSVPGAAGLGGRAWSCYDPSNPTEVIDIFGPDGSPGDYKDGGCPEFSVVQACNPNMFFGVPSDTGWYDTDDSNGGSPNGGGEGNSPPLPPEFPCLENCGPCPTGDCVPPNTGGVCGSNLVSDSVNDPGIISCNTLYSDSFVTTDGESYCTPITVPGETVNEALWTDRVWTYTPSSGTSVTIRAYSETSPLVLAIGTSNSLNSVGLGRSRAGTSQDISFIATGETYYITVEAWLSIADFQIQTFCSENEIVKVDSSWQTVLALTDNGKLFAWGTKWAIAGLTGGGYQTTPKAVYTDFSGQIVDAECDQYYTGAVMSDGTVYMSGQTQKGQLGRTTATANSYTPLVLFEQDGVTTFTKARTAKDSLATGWHHVAVAGADNHVYTWGLNCWGTLGDGLPATIYTPDNIRAYPAAVMNSDGTTFTASVKTLKAGQGHVMALLEDGTIKSWGYAAWGAVGNGVTPSYGYPTTVQKSDHTTLTNIIAIQVADSTSFALANDGHLYAWGANNYGGLGDGTTATKFYANRVKLNSNTDLTSITRISANRFSAMAIDSSDNVYVWGNNSVGQLGIGYSGGIATYPIQISMPLGTLPRIGNMGERGGNIISSSSDMVSWGQNSTGTLGDGTLIDKFTSQYLLDPFSSF